MNEEKTRTRVELQEDTRPAHATLESAETSKTTSGQQEMTRRQSSHSSERKPVTREKKAGEKEAARWDDPLWILIGGICALVLVLGYYFLERTGLGILPGKAGLTQLAIAFVLLAGTGLGLWAAVRALVRILSPLGGFMLAPFKKLFRLLKEDSSENKGKGR